MENENKYASLNDKQFSVALFTAYENLYRLTKHYEPWHYNDDKKEVLSEVKMILQDAQRRNPEINEVYTQGSLYKDSELANAERLLMPFMSKYAEKYSVLAGDFARFKAWRNEKDSVLKGGLLSEAPFQNEARWPGMNNVEQLLNPYEQGKGVMSEKEFAEEMLKISKLTRR